jgi:hypothetical protein
MLLVSARIADLVDILSCQFISTLCVSLLHLYLFMW